MSVRMSADGMRTGVYRGCPPADVREEVRAYGDICHSVAVIRSVKMGDFIPDFA